MTVFTNGRIFTGKSDHDFESSMEVNDGKISKIGNSISTDQEVVDLHGKLVLPGILDIHTHPKYIADALHGVACTPPNVTSIQDMIQALKHSASAGKSADVWIEGWGFDETKLAEHRTPTVHDLDQVSTTQPVFVYRSDCHSSVVNSKALELAGITSETPNPENGEIGKFENGTPNGYLKEVPATQLMIQVKSQQSYQTDVTNLLNSSSHYLENGIIAIGEMMGRLKPYDSLNLYEDAIKKGFKPEAAIYYVWDEVKENGLAHFASELEAGKLRIGGLKLFIDGSISGETAWVKKAYPSDPANFGVAEATTADILAAIDFAKAHQLQVAIHAMGDAAVQRVIDATWSITPWLKDGRPSVRIEHATMLTDDMLDEIKTAEMNYALVTQPIFYFAEYDSYRNFLSAEQFNECYRIKSMVASGAEVALSSDAPCTPWEKPDSPFIAIQAAVNRKASGGELVNPEEAISVGEAIRRYTSLAAPIAGFHELGTLAPGKKADFIVLDQDLFSVKPAEIGKTQVDQTWMDGQLVYSRGR